jgi:hypothetical protein
MAAIKPYTPHHTVANVFRIYDRDLAKNDAFACGWRMWSFQMTEQGYSGRKIQYHELELISSLKEVGAAYLSSKQTEWNKFRSGLLRLLPEVNPLHSFSDQYRSTFKKVAFVMIDCCFLAKYNITSITLRDILSKMFSATKTTEMPRYFAILDNDIMFAEINHKLMSMNDYRYKDTLRGINNYLDFNPSMMSDGIVKMFVPFVTTHMAMQKAECKVNAIKHKHNVSRNNFNDFAQLFLMNYIRKSFQQCARVALLSDDNHFLKFANGFIPSQLDISHSHNGLPIEYTQSPHIITPMVLDQKDWDDWRNEHALN